MSCARCHDHKFDPIPTIDYYSIAGVFHSTREENVPIAPKTAVDARTAAITSATAAESRYKDMLQAEMDALARGFAEKLPDYLAAVWTFHARKLDEPSLGPALDAQAVKLDAESFGRMMKYVGRPESPGKILNVWSKLLPTKDGPREPPAAIRAMGAKLSEAVKKNLDIPYNKRNLDIQNDLFGKKGVFPITDIDALAAMTPERRRLEEAQFRPRSWNAAAARSCRTAWIRVRPRHQGHCGEIPMPARWRRDGSSASRRRDRPFKEGSGRYQLRGDRRSKNSLTLRVWSTASGNNISAAVCRHAIELRQIGETPTHPEPFRHLASRFIAGGGR